MERQSISLKTRFEIFKRDNFTCRYCGRHAPDVELEVDHVVPVAKGGTNEFFNLVTSCYECNHGKSNRLLSDDQVTREHAKNLIEESVRLDEEIEQASHWREIYEAVLRKREERERILNEQVDELWETYGLPLSKKISSQPMTEEMIHFWKELQKKDIISYGFEPVLRMFEGEDN